MLSDFQAFRETLAPLWADKRATEPGWFKAQEDFGKADGLILVEENGKKVLKRDPVARAKAKQDFEQADRARNQAFSRLQQRAQTEIAQIRLSQGLPAGYPKIEALTEDVVILALPNQGLWDSRHPEHVFVWRGRPGPDRQGHYCETCGKYRGEI